MKIGIDCRLFSKHFGIGRYTYELVKHLVQLDADYTFVLFKNTEEQLFEGQKNIEEVFVDAGHYSLREQTRFLKTLTKARLDLMHFTHFNAPLLYRCKSIVTIHDLTLHFFPGKKMNSFLHRKAYKLVMKSVCKKAEQVIAVSQNTKNDIVEHLKIPEDKISVIYEAAGDEFAPIADTQKFDILRTRYGIKKPLLLYTGNWRTHKNLPRLIEAFHTLRELKGFDAQLMLTGKHDPKYASEIMSAIKRNNVTESVLLPGIIPEEDLAGLYNLAHVYVFPSLYEGFGLPALEAMQCGTVVCASNTSSLPEVCGLENAFFFNPYDVSDMTDALYEACGDEAKRNDIWDKALKHAATFSWEKTARETLSVYREILGKLH